ncbi:MAG: hypothetical protein GXO10_04405 [Crenarchaeota archaeon]|nr:hypothetical protein [Thermoproteota archaeon]
MRTRLIPIIVIPIVVIIAVIIGILLTKYHTVAQHHNARPLLEVLDKYFKNNTTLLIHHGYTSIKIIISALGREEVDEQKIVLDNVSIGHASSRKMKIYFIRGNHMIVTYLSSSLSTTVLDLRNFTYVLYINRNLRKAYECFKGIMILKVGTSRYEIDTKGICFIYNFTGTPYDISHLYYENLMNILRQTDCKVASSNATCTLRGSIDYVQLLYRELNMLKKIVPKYNVNIGSIKQQLNKLNKPCNIYLKASISSSELVTNEQVVCKFSKTSFEILSYSRYLNMKTTSVDTVSLLHDVEYSRKVVLGVGLRNSTRLMHLFFGVASLRNVPEPLAFVQVLNMPVGIILVLAILHMY